MILLNTTFCVNSSIADDFIGFIRDIYIPVAISSGLHAPLLTEIRAHGEPDASTGEDTRNFALQMRAPSQTVSDDFESDILPQVYSRMGNRWGQKIALFSTVMDVIYDFEHNTH